MPGRVDSSSAWARGALGVWFVAMVLLGAGLLAKHVVALPAPTADSHLSRSLAELRHPGGPRWLAAHVLYAECRCSQRIVSHLLSSRRPSGWQEVVLWVGDAPPDSTLTKRFDVLRLSEEQLGRLGVESAPLLVALDPQDHVTYVGGYTERKQGPDIRDLKILSEAERAGAPGSLPVFGCAVSERLKRALAVLPSL